MPIIKAALDNQIIYFFYLYVKRNPVEKKKTGDFMKICEKISKKLLTCIKKNVIIIRRLSEGFFKCVVFTAFFSET